MNAGAYPDAQSFGGVGDDRAASVQVGSGLAVTLFSEPGYTGRSETLYAGDRDLAGNLVGAETLSSLRTLMVSSTPLVPALNLPVDGAVYSTTDSLDPV